MDNLVLTYTLLFILVLVVVLGMVFLFITFNNRKNQLLQQQLEDQLAAQKKQYESELNALRSQLNPHFVHNSLNAIQYYIQRNEVEISEDYLTKFSKLMRLFFDYSRTKTITLKEEIAFIKKYLDIEKLRFEDKIEYYINIDKSLDTTDLNIPTMMIQPILENAVNHGIFHKTSTGTIEVDFKTTKEDNQYQIVIKDDGIGINKTKKHNRNTTGTAKAHSSAVIAERLDILNDSGDWNISFTIYDRSDIDDGTGTIVQLTIQNLSEL
ncbi:two-component sensor histidine kinase [Nonlabens ulvanivorans]|uniref:Two-component sensor histidine kinase n=1 Tax=Nonlabens ulvanivorans TaxID=906888 RepID=A0A090QVU1_NONUL|nr:histidine kinase [Nonlabens ulvanivorans]GAK99556.1 two-component sensor histidine kinase [Nonlabens ulvanivorans]